MKIKVDYHFHPHLPKNKKRALKKAKKWWQVIDHAGLNCMIITEHVYKQPQRAYEFMKKTCPRGKYCFPGIEYITREGVDIVIFSNTTKIYNYDALMTPFALSYRETVDLVKSIDHLRAFVTHPFTLGATSIVNILGLDQYHLYANELRAVEASNGSFDDLIKIFKIFPFSKLLHRKLDWAKKTQALPKNYHPHNVSLLAVGSDAHIFENVGNHVELDVQREGYRSIFQAIANNTKGKAVYIKKRFNLLALLKNLPIVVKEYLIKKKIKFWNRFFSPQYG